MNLHILGCVLLFNTYHGNKFIIMLIFYKYVRCQYKFIIIGIGIKLNYFFILRCYIINELNN